ncbi:MAG: HemK family protein methyltransferase [Candidatus Pacebacteria bacterium]|nr:HemK family protein methyltransferase [Candidatus Paceibacterota bacterium]
MKNKNFNQEIVWLLNEKYGGQLTDKAKKDITCLQKGRPVDYVIGYKNFLGCKIDLRHKPLIPREETEFWVQKAIENSSGEVSGIVFKVLDMFAGSGCCGIAVLKHIPHSRCDFVDVDDDCLKQVRLNLKINGLDKKRYRVTKSDVFSGVKGKYDLILANPPYIAFSQKAKVQKPVLDFEPKGALFARNNGLYFIDKFLQGAKNYLTPEGVIYLEFGYNQKKDIEKMLKKSGWQNYVFNKDQFGKWRYLKIFNF